ncbi:MAG: N-acetylmuramoyl-L-alanine amidase [Akkermansia sp.]|nr:N-acetylmuramoyl-L-alanine amidase [Akkermansia sp.]
MKQIIRCFLLSLLLIVCCGCSSTATSRNASQEKGVVVLDIGHFIGSGGAATPGRVNGKIISECSFWYEYSYYTKKVIEDAGYTCVVTNRGNAPTKEPLLTYARRAGVVQLCHPDKNAARYPSKYHPDRVASGMVSADYAIERNAACIVFLHHNSTGGWTNGPSNSLIICNKFNGRPLADTIARTLENEILNHRMPNGGRGCRTIVRCIDAERSAGWLNACDDSGIPAAVIEAAYLNNRAHAAYLAVDANAREYAESIGRGIVRYMRNGALPQPRHIRADENKPDQGSFGYAAESRRLNVPGAKRLVH